MERFDLLGLADFLSLDVLDYFESLMGKEAEGQFSPLQRQTPTHSSICSRTQGRLEFKDKFFRERTDSATCQRNRRYQKAKEENLIYEAIVGEIAHPPVDARQKKQGKRKSRREVRDFRQPVTNPLYVNYNPRGHVDTDEQITRDFITNTVDKFNKWLSSLEGKFTPLDPKVLIQIIREDLEIPDLTYVNPEKDLEVNIYKHLTSDDS